MDPARCVFSGRDRHEGFFKVRFDRCTPAERRYLRAMADLGEGQHRSGDIADRLSLKVTSVRPTRSGLIRKGIIYSPQHGDNTFTVPLFASYMKRAIADFPKLPLMRERPHHRLARLILARYRAGIALAPAGSIRRVHTGTDRP